MTFWLMLIAVILVAVVARVFGLTEELDRLGDACIVVLGAAYCVHIAYRRKAYQRHRD